MSFKIDNITQRKNVVKYQTQTVIEPRVIIEKPTEIHKIISNSSYTTNNETFLIVKNVDYSEVTLNSNVTNKITISETNPGGVAGNLLKETGISYQVMV